MKTPEEDLTRRQPVWEALSDLFLDTELDEYVYRKVARRVTESGYSPAEVQRILWDEVFPIVEWNLRHPAGVWEGFRLEWLQEAILSPGQRQISGQQPATASIIREAWAEVFRYLPTEYC